MKKIYSTVLILLILQVKVYACDICGCSVSNYNPFLFPHLSKNFIGLTYMHRPYHINSEGKSSSKQRFKTLLLTGQFSPAKKLQLVIMLPYQFNYLQQSGIQSKLKGFGDLTLLVNYKVWEKMTKVYRQTIQAGIGLKLATGNYTPANEEIINDQNFQLGSGSTDYLLNTSYRLSYRTWVFNFAGSYKYNTQNRENFRFGDIATSSIITAYRKDFENISVVPYLQATYEIQMQDASSHLLQRHSGGSVVYTGVGVDITMKKATFGVNYQQAPKQNLAGGEIVVKPRVSTHFSFALN